MKNAIRNDLFIEQLIRSILRWGVFPSSDRFKGIVSTQEIISYPKLSHVKSVSCNTYIFLLMFFALWEHQLVFTYRSWRNNWQCVTCLLLQEIQNFVVHIAYILCSFTSNVSVYPAEIYFFPHTQRKSWSSKTWSSHVTRIIGESINSKTLSYKLSYHCDSCIRILCVYLPS